jgi:catechol 2,3-dioxygenase-like lactoylglutathione lyase family enzyme
MTHINRVGTVIVPVSDQARALAFYVTKLGFEQVSDFTYGDGERWVEVSAPGDSVRIALAASGNGHTGVETGVALGADDADAAHADLLARGADVDAKVMRQGDPAVRWGGTALAGVPPMFRVYDPDGNSFLVVAAPD